jgi:putative tricarboxylic transport membrane protein
MAPADISKADYLNMVKAMDILRVSHSWLEEVKKNNWDNDFSSGLAFKSFLEKHIPEITKVIKALGI